MNKAVDPAVLAQRDRGRRAPAARWTRSGCRSPPTASSRRRRACWPRPRACTTGRPRAARCSTASPACGASTPATRARRSSQAIQRAGRRTGLRAAVPDGATRKAFELAERLVAADAARAEQGLLHQLGLRSRRDRAEDGDRLPPRPRRRHAHPPDRPRARLPRRQLRRHLGRRHRRPTARCSARCSAASTTCATRTTWRATPSRAACREHGAELADDLERLVALHDASTIAAVIVEPVAGSTGVLLPPKGYLQRLRAICDKHGILLIFDEVITGFGRLGSPFAAHAFGVTPDLMTLRQGHHQRLRADGRGVREAADPRRLHERPRAPDRVLPRLHLLGHPLACAAGARHAGHLRRRGNC